MKRFERHDRPITFQKRLLHQLAISHYTLGWTGWIGVHNLKYISFVSTRKWSTVLPTLSRFRFLFLRF